MENDGETRRKVDKYLRLLNREEKVDYALKRLSGLHITLEILSETGVGRAVNQLRDDPQYGEEARKIVERWKELARSHGLCQRSDQKSPENPKHDYTSSKKDKKAKKHRAKDGDSLDSKRNEASSSNDAGSSKSGLSFADMLASADNVKPPKSKKLKIDWKSSPVDVNYAPSRRLNLEPAVSTRQPVASKNSTLDSAMFRPRKDARKIFAGRPKGDYGREVSSLIEICIRVLVAHIDAIEETGDIPFDLLKPILEKCTPEQLRNIERINPYLMEDSDELWEKIVSRSFPSGMKENSETWRDCFQRLCEEKEVKLRSISSRITQHNKECAVPVKKAILAEAKAPREVRRRQIRHGTGHVQRELPSASELSKARKAIFDRGTKDAFQNLPQAVRNTTSTLGAHSDKKRATPKKGALMVKTLKMLKCKNRK